MADEALLAPGRSRVRVSTTSGRITVIGERRDDIVVTTGGRTTAAPVTDEVDVVMTASSDRVEVRCPVGTDVVVGTASGKVELEGHLGEARVTTASGSIQVDTVASADLRTQSAKVEVEECLGSCRVMNKSGRVEIHRAGEVLVKNVSGAVDVSGDDVNVRTVSGKVRIETYVTAAVETVSGGVEVWVPEGFRPEVHSHGLGRVTVDVPQGTDGEILVRTVSGSVRVRSR